MACSFINGFELGHAQGEFYTLSGGLSVDATRKRSGSYSLRCVPADAIADASWRPRDASAAYINPFRSVRFYLYVATLPSVSTIIYWLYDTASYHVLRLDNAGKLQVGGGTVSTNAIQTGQWYRINVYDNGTTVYADVDGTNWATGTSYIPTASIRTLHLGAGVACTGEWYFDDLRADDAANVNIGDGKVVLLKPISDNNRNTWTGGGLGTTNLFDAVNNIPPTGTDAEDDTTQIECNTNPGTAALFNCTSYTNAGIGASDTINAVGAFASTGEDASSGTKTGCCYVASNPTQADPGAKWQFGDNAGTLAAFPTNWRPEMGPIVESPTVTKGTSPVVAVAKTDTGTAVASCCFVGIYVDYTPATGGTQNQKTLDMASLALAGALVRKDSKPLTGSLVTSGAITKKGSKVFAGTLALAGSVVKKVAHKVSGSLALAGSALKQIKTSVFGGLTFSVLLEGFKTQYVPGVVLKTIEGTVTFSGSLPRKTKKAVSGVLATAGSMVRHIHHTVTGTLTLAGTIARGFYKKLTLAGTVAFAGTIAGVKLIIKRGFSRGHHRLWP